MSEHTPANDTDQEDQPTTSSNFLARMNTEVVRLFRTGLRLG